MLEAIASGLRKIGCKAEKRKLIMRVLQDGKIMDLCIIKLLEEQSLSDLQDSDGLDELYIPMEEAEANREAEIKSDPSLDSDPNESFFVWDITYPESIKGGEKKC